MRRASVTDSFGRDGSLREGGRVAAPEPGDHRLSDGDVGRRGRAAGAGISAGHVYPATEIEEDGVDVDGLLAGELVQGSFDGSDDQTGGEARHEPRSRVRLRAQRARRDVDGRVPLLRREVHVHERGIDDRVAERIRGMATKAFGEFGGGLEPSATSGQRCTRRRRAGWHRSGLTPATRRRRGRCRPPPNGRGAPSTGQRRRRERSRSSSRTRRAVTGRRRLGRRSARPRSDRRRRGSSRAWRWRAPNGGARALSSTAARECSSPTSSSPASVSTTPSTRKPADRDAASCGSAAASARLAQCSARSNRQNMSSAWARPPYVKAAPAASCSGAVSRSAAACAYVSALSSIEPDDHRNRASRSYAHARPSGGSPSSSARRASATARSF